MLSLGIDIGGTKAHGVVLDDQNKILAEQAVATLQGAEGVSRCLVEVADRIADQLAISTHDFDSVGIGIPGVVDRQVGAIASAVNLSVEQMPLRELVQDHFSALVRLDNDVKATTVAAGLLLGSTSVTYINVGTGIAAATIDGRLIRGAANGAGEIGHMVVNPCGDPCRCGQRGCLETIIGGAYLAPRMAALGLDWATLDQDQSPAGRAGFDQGVSALGQMISLVSVAYAPQRIVLGGGVIAAAQWVVPALQQWLRQRSQTVSFPPLAAIADTITTLDPGLNAPAIGAALTGRSDMEGFAS
ncbi:MAG: ROK family protein [Propionibacteriaceae bacterium]|jgi:predicted NBD/HSP70 family sugar kinase|nr:ROK family protein [Propionibacteriaceae bacterium]